MKEPNALQETAASATQPFAYITNTAFGGNENYA